MSVFAVVVRFTSVHDSQHSAKEMHLFLIQILAFFVSTAFSQETQVLREKPSDSILSDGLYLQDRFKGPTVTCGSRIYRPSNDYTHAKSALNDTTITKSILDDKIVGGNETRQGEIPWQARVTLSGYQRPTDYDCGAVIINEFWLLSAAHCFYGRARWRRHVIVGEYHLYRKDPGEQKFEVDKIFKHEMYNTIPRDYDIALIKIKPSRNGRGIRFNNFVQPICLPDSTTSLRDGTTLIVSGWGWTLPCRTCQAGTQNMPDVLMKAIIPLIGQDKCKQFYGKRITDRMFCAGYANGSIDSCKGDSGGPVVYETGGYYSLYGIVSWGGGCAQPNLPGVYARVIAMVSWIQATVKSNSLNSLQSVIPSKPQ